MIENTIFTSGELYQEFLIERKHVLLHKYYESQKAGKDVGFEWALMDWITNYKSKFREWRNQILKEKHEKISN